MNLNLGFISIRTLIVIVFIIIALGMFGINIEDDIVENTDVRDNTSYVWTGVSRFWNTYLAGPADYIWNDVFVGLIWESFIINMQALRNGESATNFQLQGDLPYPSVPNYIDGYQTTTTN